ncbi:hypothetical protein [Cohnella abietis]|uniref:Uncharacterized protein n=1 Tax=Cohnella abietis TaxID=2507935 RepID=A0A3T1D957_9BACL|nr:hypothetical protein [Cohnella abietis]BBI34604.1 hypothetical protein KCTCHS21_40030 [Cohnella abietis]
MKKLFQLLLVLTLVLSIGNAAYAESSNETSKDVLAVQAVRDPEPNIISPFASGETIETSALGAKYVDSKAFIRFLSSSWSKADKYNWTESQSYSLSFTTSVATDVAKAIKANFGLAGSYTSTYSVGTSIPADQTKFSKLSYNMDLNKQYVKYRKKLVTCNVASCWESYTTWTETTYIEPTANSYLIVNYQ